MLEFFALSFIFFLILLGGNGYYSLLGNKEQQKGSKKKTKTKRKSSGAQNIIIFIGILLFLITASLVVIFFLSQNILLLYSGLLTYIMLAAATYLLSDRPYWWLFSLLVATVLIALQVAIKNPTLGNLLIIFGYIGVTTYIMKSKFLPPKIIIAFFTLYALYDLIGVFFIPLQTALADKTLNDIFPPAIAVGRTFVGNGDLLMALLMTAFTRAYFGLSVAVISALLFSLPLALLGIVSRMFPQINITVPYLVLMTPFFLAVVLFMRKKGYTLG